MRSIGLGDLEQPSEPVRVYQGARYAWTQTVSAVVESVVGEFNWKIEVGETVEATEIAGPEGRKISEERTAQEIAVSLSTPITLAEIERAFGGAVTRAPARPVSRSPFWIGLAALFVALSIVDFASARREVVLDLDVPSVAPGSPSAAPAAPPQEPPPAASDEVPPDAPSPAPELPPDAAPPAPATPPIEASATFSEPFQIPHGGKNLVMTIAAPDLQNSWIGADLALVDTDTGSVWEDSVELSYYFGVEDGESWREGETEKSLRYSRLPAGTYVLRIEHAADPLSRARPTLHLRLVSDDPSAIYFLAACGGLLVSYHEALVHPAFAAARERKRILITGGGDGLAAREVLRYPEVASVTLVDIDPEMTRLAGSLPLLRALNQGSLEDPRLHVVHADAMVWIADLPPEAKFDVLLVDFPDPNNFALGELYTTRFYNLARAHLAPGGAIAVQSTSPLFARESFWCIARTMEAAGLVVRPYHTAVPSFGEWGFAFAKAEPFDLPPRPLVAGLRFLDAPTLASLFVLSADMLAVPVEINRLNNQILVQYYEREWKRWN